MGEGEEVGDEREVGWTREVLCAILEGRGRLGMRDRG